MPESTAGAQRACIRAQAQRVRELLAPRADSDLESAALAARATLGDRGAIREITFKPARVKTFNPWGWRPDAAEEDADWRQAARTGPLWLRNLFVRA